MWAKRTMQLAEPCVRRSTSPATLASAGSSGNMPFLRWLRTPAVFFSLSKEGLLAARRTHAVVARMESYLQVGNAMQCMHAVVVIVGLQATARRCASYCCRRASAVLYLN